MSYDCQHGRRNGEDCVWCERLAMEGAQPPMLGFDQYGISDADREAWKRRASQTGEIYYRNQKTRKLEPDSEPYPDE